MSILVSIGDNGKTSLLVAVKERTFSISNGKITNVEPIKFPVATRGLLITEIKFKGFTIPLDCPKNVLRGIVCPYFLAACQSS